MASQAFPPIAAAQAHAVVALVHGCTFDDFLLTPQESVVVRRDPEGSTSPLSRIVRASNNSLRNRVVRRGS